MNLRGFLSVIVLSSILCLHWSPSVIYANENPVLLPISLQIPPQADSNGRQHDINVYRLVSSYSGKAIHFVHILSGTREIQELRPVIIQHLPYTLFPSPPSEDPIDVFWTEYVREQPTFDLSLPENEEILKCRTTRCRMGVQFITVEEMMQAADWALRVGYSYIFTFGRFYAGQGTLEPAYDLIEVVNALRTMPAVAEIGMFGKSLGGLQVLYALSRRENPLQVNAAATLMSPVDLRELVSYYAFDLPGVQQPEMLLNFYDAVMPFFNRTFKSVGTDWMSSAWDSITNQYVSDNMQTPLFLITGTDDMLAPYTQSEKLYLSLREAGKNAEILIYQNGAPPFARKSALEWGHGLMDSNSELKWPAALRDFFLTQMPPR